MADKYAFDVAAGFAPQSAEGTYNTTLAGIVAAGTWGGDADGTDQGLLLGAAGVGIGDSGLDITMEKRRLVKPPVGTSFTRPMAEHLAVDISSFSFAFPLAGPKRTTTATPIDSDFAPLMGVEGIINGAGLVAAVWGSGVGYSWMFGSPPPFSALIVVSGLALELKDCRCSSLAFEFTPGSVAIATATIEVGSINDPTATPLAVSALPTLDYALQSSVSSPVVESINHVWAEERGFQSLTLTITPNIVDIPDSNATDGIIKEQDGRETTIAATMFGDSTGLGEVYEADQLFQTADSGLDELSFTVGTAATGSDAALAYKVSIPKPEVLDVAPGKLGSKAGPTVNLVAGHGTANTELEITNI